MLRTFVDTGRAYAWWLSVEARSRIRGDRRAPPSERKHALLLASALPPFVTGGVYRPLSWMQYARKHGWTLTAITHALDGEATPAGRHLNERIPPEVVVHRLEASEWIRGRPSWRFFQNTAEGFDRALALADCAMRTMRESPPDVVVATGPPFEAFIAAAYVARRYACPLVLDYRDEWTECPFEFVRPGRLDRAWEGRCLAAADRVFFTTKSQLRHQSQVFGRALEGKAAVLPNGWEERDFLAPAEMASGAGASRSHALRLKFVGRLGQWMDPIAFLADLDLVREALPGCAIEIEFVGQVDSPIADAIDARFGHLGVRRSGVIPKSEVALALREADALLLFAPPQLERYLPGKLYDYLASAKPVLVHGHPGEHSRLVEELGSGLFVPAGDHTALANALDTLRTRFGEAWNPPRRQAWLRDHTREALAARFFAMLDGVTATYRAS